MKPDDLFGRDSEWRELERHVTSGAARLGIVTGRRRVGKTFLLRRLAQRHGGLMTSCLEEAKAPALARFSAELGAFHGLAIGTPADWATAIGMATTGPLAVPLLIIDEFPYLLGHSPELESVLQHAVDSSRDVDGTRIILAGSSLSVMGDLLDGSRPLRGRADVQMRLEPFDYRTARSFWNVQSASLAFRLHAVLGGSPGYRALSPAPPETVDGFDGWVQRAILNPATALYREDQYLLAEDRRLGDAATYGSILRAIANGEHRPSKIGARVGRQQTSLSHGLSVLSASGFVHNDAGILSAQDPLYRLTDEIVIFLRACVEPWRPLIDEGRSADAWAAAHATWGAGVLGPHLERITRAWANRFATAEVLGGQPGLVGRADLPDRTTRTACELDLVVLRAGSRAGHAAQVLAIGETKLTAHLDAIAHLDRAVRLLEAKGHGRPERLLVIAESFSPDVIDAAARRSELHLVSLAEIYDH